MRSLAALIAFAVVVGFTSAAMSMGSSHDEGRPGARAAVADAKAKGMPVFVDAGSDHCVPCKQMVPVLDALRKKYDGKVAVVFVDVEEERGFAVSLGVNMIPTQIMFDKTGREAGRHVGFMSEEEADEFIGKAVD